MEHEADLTIQYSYGRGEEEVELVVRWGRG